jgi:hypothetical protein
VSEICAEAHPRSRLAPAPKRVLVSLHGYRYGWACKTASETEATCFVLFNAGEAKMDIPARRLPTDEGGEFELILGNRQLLSVFSSMVILLGVFFTMGYIVGSYSTPVAVADVNPKRKRETKPLVVESPGARPAEPAAAEPPRRKFASPAPITTAPLQPAETPKPPKNETVKSEPVESVKAEKSAPASGGAPSGTYLQPAARTKDEADIIVAALRQKKFAVITAKVPGNPALFRVLVGPLAEAQVDKTKTDLQNAGFTGDKSIKRSF